MTPVIVLRLGLALAGGAVAGSYATTVGMRLARGERSGLGRSRCDACGVRLGFAQTTPIASFAWQGGRCAACRAPIDRVHLAGELIGVAVATSAIACAGSIATAALLVVLGLLLLAVAVVDLKCGRLPNALTLAIAVTCALLAARSSTRLTAGLIAAALSAFALLIVRRVARASSGEPGLGLGDVKLFAGLALWVGPLTPWMIAAAAGLGLAVAGFTRERRIRFGPMICMAAWVVGMAGERIHG